MSFKPVYVPKGNRRRTAVVQQRYNAKNHQSRHDTNNNGDDDAVVPACIDSKDVLSKVQRPEDFMDEQDHNEWGGPTKVKAEFEERRRIMIPKDDDDNETTTRNKIPLDLTVRSLNIGELLLRKLGWRDSEIQSASSPSSSFLTAYVPVDSTNKEDDQHSTNTFKVGMRHLQKIMLQQSRVAIPPPWKGRWGLGYQSELTKTTASTAKSSRQYRLSNVVVNASGMIVQPQKERNHSIVDDADYNYEATTLEDFVGTHSSAGFALREDEDDAYDDSMTNEKSFHSTVLSFGGGTAAVPPKPKHLVDQTTSSLLMEAYEHQDSDSDDGSKAPLKNKAAGDFEGALSSWVMGGKNAATGTAMNSRPTSAIIDGFVLGANSTNTRPKLYRGPDVPKEWRIQPHVFGPNEHPSILKAIAHATKLAVAQERRAKTMSEALQAATLAPRQQRSIFAGIGEQMKNRFTASSNDDHPEGIRDAAVSTSASQIQSTEKTLITRTIKSFVPEPLLCKRLNVSAPTLTEGAPTATLAPRRDEVFFQTQVLGAVAEETKKRAAETTSAISLLLNNDDNEDDNPSKEPQRPALHVYKSIFDPDIADDQDDNAIANAIADTNTKLNNNAIVPFEHDTGNKPPSPTLPQSNATLVPFYTQKSDQDNLSESSSSSTSEHRKRQHRKRKQEKSSKNKTKKRHKKSKKSRRRDGSS